MQVLGVGPYEKQSHKNPTDILADNIIKATSAPAGVQSHYIKNLSLLVRDCNYNFICNTMMFINFMRKFIREARPNSDKLHEQFRTWLDENPTLTGNLEDQLVNYENGDPIFAQVEEATNNYP